MAASEMAAMNTDPANTSGPSLANTVVPLSASGQYTTVTEAAPPPGGRGAARRAPTVRTKLALIYGSMFVGAGIVLIVLIYLLVFWRLNHPKANLPSWCTLTAADRAQGIKLTAAQNAACTRLQR